MGHRKLDGVEKLICTRKRLDTETTILRKIPLLWHRLSSRNGARIDLLPLGLVKNQNNRTQKKISLDSKLYFLLSISHPAIQLPDFVTNYTPSRHFWKSSKNVEIVNKIFQTRPFSKRNMIWACFRCGVVGVEWVGWLLYALAHSRFCRLYMHVEWTLIYSYAPGK